MKLTFIHDGPVFYDSTGNYYEFAYHELYQRYSYMANNITFLIRTKPIDKMRKYTIIPKQIEIVDVPNFKDPKKYLINKKIAESIVEKQIKNTDIAVLRLPSSIPHLALKYLIKYNKPYIIESVGCSWDSYWNHSMLGKVVAPYMYLKDRKAIMKADYVYYVTTEFLQHRYPTKGKTISCSNVVIDPLDQSTLERRIQKIAKFNPKRKLILGTAAAIDTRYKGHEYVIKIIPQLIKKGYNVEYRLAGGMTSQNPNTFLKDLAKEKGIEDRIVFYGSLSSSQMPDYYDSLDIYVQPSKQEGLPRAVIEAMSRGCPVIGTNIAGIPELIQSQCLFKKGSSVEVIRALERILSMDLESIASRNFEKAKEYERDKLVNKRQDFYDTFISDFKNKHGK